MYLPAVLSNRPEASCPLAEYRQAACPQEALTYLLVAALFLDLGLMQEPGRYLVLGRCSAPDLKKERSAFPYLPVRLYPSLPPVRRPHRRRLPRR